MNYQTEDAYVNPNNLTKAGPNIPELYKKENRSQKKKDKPQAEFDQIHEKVREVPGKDATVEGSDEEEDEPFVDEFGNVVDKDSNEDAITARAKELLNSPK